MSDRVDLLPDEVDSVASPSTDAAPRHLDEGPSPDEILRRLNDGTLSHPDRRVLVIEAEAADFERDQLDIVNDLLRAFIAANRRSGDSDDLVAVGAAVRKCIATLPADEAFAYAAELLDSQDGTAASAELELEATKMVVRKLMANPPPTADVATQLADRLFEIVRSYVNPRILPQRTFGAIALNAVLALAILQDRHASEVHQIVAESNVPWFRQMVARRAARLRDERAARFPDGSSEGSLGSLAGLDI